MLAGHLFEHLIQIGTLRVVDADGETHTYGGADGPRMTICLRDKSLHWKLFWRPDLYLGEAYTDGSLTIENAEIYDLLALCGINIQNLYAHPVSKLGAKVDRVLRYIHQHNPLGTAQRNVAHHYDLSGRLYDLFLDKDRQYSCAYFTRGNDSLEVAQDNKKRHIAAKMLLRPNQRILDIGSGWGGMALYLARTAPDARITGVTLSKEQHGVSVKRAAEAGLADRVCFRFSDYRDQEGPFDRVVSVGMFEHVGVRHYDEFFTKLNSLLADDGIALLHSIGRMEPPAGTNPWLRKYIFPGGYTPALSEVMRSIEKTDLWVTDIEILRLHYAETLREWRRRFVANRDQIRDLYDERFCRMWEFYLAGSEVAFRHMRQMVFQLQIAKRRESVPLTRDYIVEWERGDWGAGNQAH